MLYVHRTIKKVVVDQKHVFSFLVDRYVFKCGICQKSFSRQGNLRKHVSSVHEGRRDFKCQTCQKSYSVKKSLLKHMKKHLQKCNEAKAEKANEKQKSTDVIPKDINTDIIKYFRMFRKASG